ncbi:hypothetical protein [Desulfosarcina variabilis]|uniref:hypothetical protein n=1 Tax=Desulfosarcina variabilis TaxID=2300 RepID=UPI003AFB4E10
MSILRHFPTPLAGLRRIYQTGSERYNLLHTPSYLPKKNPPTGVKGLKSDKRDNDLKNRIFPIPFFDELVKSSGFVMPDLIRHPEHIEKTGFRPTPE